MVRRMARACVGKDEHYHVMVRFRDDDSLHEMHMFASVRGLKTECGWRRRRRKDYTPTHSQ